MSSDRGAAKAAPTAADHANTGKKLPTAKDVRGILKPQTPADHANTVRDVTPELSRHIFDAIRLVIAAEATDARKVAAIAHLVERFPYPDGQGTSSVRIFIEAIVATQGNDAA